MPENKSEQFIVSPPKKHFDNVVAEFIVMKGDIPTYQKWQFLKEDFPCGSCKITDGTRFMVLKTGVYRSCTLCGVTEKVLTIDYDTKEEMARLIDEKRCSVEEAWEILAKTGADRFPPAGLPKSKSSKARRKPKIEVN